MAIENGFCFLFLISRLRAITSTMMTFIGTKCLTLLCALVIYDNRVILIFCNNYFCSFVHGRLPYELLRPDPVLRGLLLSLPVRKVVSFINPEMHSDVVIEEKEKGNFITLMLASHVMLVILCRFSRIRTRHMRLLCSKGLELRTALSRLYALRH